VPEDAAARTPQAGECLAGPCAGWQRAISSACEAGTSSAEEATHDPSRNGPRGEGDPGREHPPQEWPPAVVEVDASTDADLVDVEPIDKASEETGQCAEDEEPRPSAHGGRRHTCGEEAEKHTHRRADDDQPHGQISHREPRQPVLEEDHPVEERCASYKDGSDRDEDPGAPHVPERIVPERDPVQGAVSES
jgi:hypothetical protein